ncbi:MAG: cytochrome c oxidase subunit 3 [candidate division NC10 bacterium]|nr:cytochrome c oxidase subunit 3 [candidate division NC10 bacterium]
MPRQRTGREMPGATESPVVERSAEDPGPEHVRFGGGPPPDSPRDPFGPGDNGRGQRPVSNARLGMLIFLGAEAMFFAGLIGAFLVFRLGSATWPPPGQPYLRDGVTGINTVVLLFSAYTMRRALRAVRAGDRRGLVGSLVMTALLGTVFLGVQGYEWVRLVRFGFTLASGTYGATFYTLIGLHGAHVFGAVLWLLIVLAGAWSHRFSPARHVGVTLCGMYWYFVVGLWPVLYTLVYLS